MSLQDSHQISDVKIMLVKGADGNGITNIEKTGQEGLTDIYTITYSDGSRSTFTVTNGASGGMSAMFLITSEAGATITVTSPSSRSLDVTQVSGSSTQWFCDTVEYGDHIVTFTINGQTTTVTVTVDACKIYEVTGQIIPNGSTVTPTDDIQTLLNCANIWDKSYTTLTELLADTTTLSAVISSNNAIDYLVRSTSWAGIGLVPTMTSNTTPSGLCGATSEITNAEAFRAFDNDMSTNWATDVGILTGKVYYKFDNAIKPIKVKVYPTVSGNTRSVSGKVICSSDGTNWTELSSETYFTNGQWTEISISSNSSALYWGILATEHNAPSSSQRVLLTEVQFISENLCADQTAMSYIGLNNYASNTLLANATWCNAICNSQYFESVLNVKVPTMTSNTTPSGECFGSQTMNSSHPAYYAFDGNNSTWAEIQTASLTARVCYDFGSNKKIYKVGAYDATGVNGQISYSDDGSNWTDDSNSFAIVSNAWSWGIINSSNNHRYWGFKRTANSSSVGTAVEIQFYGRSDV